MNGHHSHTHEHTCTYIYIYMYMVAALIFSKLFLAVFYEFSKPLWLLVRFVCLLIVSTQHARHMKFKLYIDKPTNEWTDRQINK